jgi:hypothetical protein
MMRRAERQPLSEMSLYGGVFTKVWIIPDAGTLVPSHSHAYPHQSFLFAGSIHVWQDDEDMGEFHAPAVIKIPERTKHRFLSLVPMVGIACIHSVALGEADFHEDDLVHEEHQLPIEETA